MIQRLSPSIGTYIVLLIVLAALGAMNTFLPQGSLLPEQPLLLSKPVMALFNGGNDVGSIWRFGIPWIAAFTKV
jgi:hypothetical protein